ncbi:MAG: asparagine synthase (glutamine-hydrolyzing) [Ginsengibacter sp.]
MCGIAGIIGKIDDGTSKIQAMLQKQQHRGPDAHAYWHKDLVTFGHNRLSIIDLNECANQPMHSSCQRYTLVFNGEIYNYKELKKELENEYSFQTHSDTEVVLAAFKKWGKNMLERLNGMFAFCIYDQQDKTVFAARDRFGVKPFHYAIHAGCLYFASEIKTLWAAGIPKVRNLPVWANYLAHGMYGLPHETFWQDIHQLPASHYFETTSNSLFSKNRIKPKLWYDFAARIQQTPQLEIDELKTQYQYLLQDAIRLRFRADVPVGFNISGGLDSSTLLALVNDAYPKNSSIEAFTFYTGHPEYDELLWVEQMIQLTRNPLNKCLLESNDVAALIDQVSYYQDEPYGGFPTLAYSLLFKAAREKGILVLLDGQGMDEAWAGYDYYQTNTGHTIQGTNSSPVRPGVLDNEFIALATVNKFPEPFGNRLQNLQYRDLFYTKIPRALRFNDRISMMHSTELREPFLDYRLVELAFAQKADVKIKQGQSKWLLRQIVKDKLGDQVALAPKRPLQTPQREWIARELKDLIDHKVNEFADTPFVNKAAVLKCWADYLGGDNENSFYIWQWTNLATLMEPDYVNHATI